MRSDGAATPPSNDALILYVPLEQVEAVRIDGVACKFLDLVLQLFK